MQSTTIPERDEQAVHLRDYWRLLWSHRWTAGAIFLGVVLTAGVWTFLQQPIYRATATVEALSQARRVMSGPDVSGLGASGFGWSAEERFYATQVEIITSRDMARRVIKRLALHDDPEWTGVADLPLALSKLVSATLRKDTGIIEVSVTGPDPRKAVDLANAFAQEYVQRNIDLGSAAVAQVVADLQKQIEPIRHEIELAEKLRYGIAEEQQLFAPENEKEIYGETLKTFQNELTEVQIGLTEAVGVITALEDIRRSGGDPLTIRQIGENPGVRTLVEQQNILAKDVEGLRVKYRPGASELKETESQLARVREDLAKQIVSIEGQFRAEVLLNTAKAKRLEEQLARVKEESLKTGKKTSAYDIAKTDVETRRKVYDSLLQSVNQISLQASVLNNNLTVLDAAIVPTAPIAPRTRLNLAIGAMIGMMLGIGSAFFLDYLDNTIKSSDDIEQILRLNLLSVIPRYRETTGHAVREAYQTLRTSVLFSSKARQNRILLVTSAGPREGKTSTIVNLARTIANAGERVLLMDCDLRRPKIHEDLGLDRDHGLTNYLAGLEAGSYRDFLKPTNVTTLFALTCGPIPPNPPELFGLERFRELLAALKRDFDWVLIDSPPVVALTDAVILASMADMVAFVVKHNENDRDMIRRCVGNIRNVNPNVIGAVLNNVDIERGGADYYYTGYYYYTSEAEETRKRRHRKDAPRVAARSTTGSSAPGRQG